jgi:hypothetical protein
MIDKLVAWFTTNPTASLELSILPDNYTGPHGNLKVDKLAA